MPPPPVSERVCTPRAASSALVLTSALTALLDLVFPPFCPVCRARLGEGRRDPLCGACWAGLERLTGPVCGLCGQPIAWLGQGPRAVAPTCGACRRHRPRFSYARAAADYGDTVREAVHAFKFRGRRALAAPLGDLLAGLEPPASPGPPPSVIVPVPLHARRERERGFNQAELLARRLGRAWDVPVAARALVRSRATPAQADLPADARRANVRGAFAVRAPGRVAGRHVLLVDDVLTTGATAGACAAALLDAGAAAVGVLTVARVS